MKSEIFLILTILLLLSSFVYADFQEPRSTQGEPIQNWWNTIVEICNGDYNLDPYLIAAMVKKESWFDESAENLAEKQAYLSGQAVWYENYWGKGLTQVTGPWTAGVPTPRRENWENNMPAEAVWEEAPIMNDPFNGRENLARGCWYFSVLMEHYNNDEFSAVTAYNKGFFGTDAGMFDVRNNDYVNDVMRYKNDYLANINNQDSNNSAIGIIKIDNFPQIPDEVIYNIVNKSNNNSIHSIDISFPENFILTPNNRSNQNNTNSTIKIIRFNSNDEDNDKREYGPAGRNRRGFKSSSLNYFDSFNDINYIGIQNNQNKKNVFLN